MVGKAEVTRTKCGEIFILPGNTLSLVCDCCGDDFFMFEDLCKHLNDHFPKSPTNIKIEDSDSYISECEAPCPHDVQDNFIDILQDDIGTLPTVGEFHSLPERSDSVKLVTIIKTEESERVSPNGICELLSNSMNENENTKSGSLLIEQPDSPKPESIQSEHDKSCEVAPKQRRSNRLSTKRPRHGNASKLKAKRQTNTNRDQFSLKPHNFDTADVPMSPNVNFKCRFCCKILTTKQHLNDHVNIHIGERPHKCQICSKTFTQSSSLSKHIKALHTQERRHQCSTCTKGFVSKSNLDCHIREKHLPDDDPRRYFPCKLCDDKFKTATQLSNHNSRIHKQKSAKFTCVYCQRKYTRQHNLLQHIQNHARTQNMKCQHCNKMFAHAKNKIRHERECNIRIYY